MVVHSGSVRVRVCKKFSVMIVFLLFLWISLQRQKGNPSKDFKGASLVESDRYGLDYVDNYFLNTNPPNKVNSPKSAKPKLILIWNNYLKLGKGIYKTLFKSISSGDCPVSNCEFTVDKARQNESDAILFHMPNLHWEKYNYPKYRRRDQPWILMSYESAPNVQQRGHDWGKHPLIDWNKLKGVFNRTMTFRKDSDIMVRHGFFEKRNVPLTDIQLTSHYSQQPQPDFSHYTPEFYATYKNEDMTTYVVDASCKNCTRRQPPAAPIAWFVSHCKAHSGRQRYIAWLQRYIGVDVYGLCGPLHCGKVKNVKNTYNMKEDPCFKLVNKKYRFYISFENAICSDYVTEKMFNAFNLNTIPVVMGGANYSEILPPNSYINAAQFHSPEHLSDFLYLLLRNETLYSSFFAWRRHYDVYSFTSVPDPCHLCEKMNSGELLVHKEYTRFYEWFNVKARCFFNSIFGKKWEDWAKLWRKAGKRSAPFTQMVKLDL